MYVYRDEVYIHFQVVFLSPQQLLVHTGHIKIRIFFKHGKILGVRFVSIHGYSNIENHSNH